MHPHPKAVALLGAIVTAFTLAAAPAGAREKESYCNWKGVTAARIDRADAALYRDGNPAIEELLKTNLPFGMPEETGDKHGERLLAQKYYIIRYDSDLRAPLWTAELLTKAQAGKHRTRADSFRSDPRLSSDESSECADYKEPIFDQGHMTPRGDMNQSNTAMDDTFLMSNMTPQHCAFNRGVWEVLEQTVRDWARQVDKTWIITGAIYDRENPVGRDPDADAWRMKGKRGRRVAIPNLQYKIVIRAHGGGGYETLSIMLPNNDEIIPKAQIPKYLAGHVTTIAAIAQRSGFRFLHDEQVTEDVSLWKLADKWAAPLTSRCKPSYPGK